MPIARRHADEVTLANAGWGQAGSQLPLAQETSPQTEVASDRFRLTRRAGQRLVTMPLDRGHAEIANSPSAFN